MARRKRPDEQLRALSQMVQLASSAVDKAVFASKPLHKYAPEAVERLERVGGEIATQLDACAQSAEDAAETLTRLLPPDTPPNRE